MKLKQINKPKKCPVCKKYSLEWLHYENVNLSHNMIVMNGKEIKGRGNNEILRCKNCLAEFEVLQ